MAANRVLMWSNVYSRPCLTYSVLFLLGACVSDSGQADSANGTSVVQNPVPSEGGLAHLRLVQRYGEAYGSAEAMLGHVIEFAVGPQGEVYIYDYEQGIKRFSPDGRFEAWTARYGQGPAEVVYPYGMTVNHAGDLAIFDSGLGRIKIFRTSGEVETAPRPEGIARTTQHDVIEFHEDGNLWIGVNPPIDQLAVQPRPIFARLSANGAFVDTLYAPDWLSDAPCDVPSERSFGGGVFEDKREPFIPKPKWSLGTDGRLVVGCPSDYAFAVVDVDGAVLRVRAQWTPIILSEEARSFFTNRLPWPIPAGKPAYSRLLLDGVGGRIWVAPEVHPKQQAVSPEVSQAVGEDYAWVPAPIAAFDVFDSSGYVLGSVELPSDLQFDGYGLNGPIVIRGDTIWAGTRDSLGVHFVSKYEVVWPHD